MAHKSTKITSVICCAIAVLAMVCTAARADDLNGALVKLFDQYRLPRTLHCKVTTVTDYKTIPPGLFHVDGTQEYWMDGPKYRILQTQNSAVFPGMSHDVRWDGERFQWLNLADSTLIVSTAAKQKTPYIGEPIPLLPLSFVNPAGEDESVRLPLDELRGDQIRDRFADAKFDGADHTKMDFPGGKMGDIDYSFQIEFDAAQSYLPTTIRRQSSDGVALETDEILYQAVQCDAGTLYLPRRAKLTNRTTDNRLQVVTTCTVTLMEADIPIPPELFTVSYQTAKTVINADKFAKPRHASMLNAPGPKAPPGQPAVRNAIQMNSVALGPSVITSSPSGDWDFWPTGIVTQILIGLVAFLAGLAFLACRRPPVGREP